MQRAWIALALVACLPFALADAQAGESEAMPAIAVPPAVTLDSASTSPTTIEPPEQKRKRSRAEAREEKRARRPRKKSPYDLLVDSWHEPAPEELVAAFRAAAVPELVLRIQGKDETYVIRPSSRQGGFDETQLATAKLAFGSWENGPTPHPRTLDLIYAATLHFETPYVHLISGIRKDRGGSRHSHGLAADVVFPGVDNEELAAFFRAQGFVGVGTYPRSGFVHIDTRDKSYFWIDYSKPHRRGRIQTVRAEEAKLVDEEAVARGSGGFVNPPRLQKALVARAVRKRRAVARKAELARGVASPVESPAAAPAPPPMPAAATVPAAPTTASAQSGSVARP